MLTLTCEVGEKVIIGNGIEVVVRELRGHQVRLQLSAPNSLPIYREELYRAMASQNTRAAASAAMMRAAGAARDIVELPLGPFGYREKTDFVVHPAEIDAFSLLESAQAEGLRFAVIDVLRFVPDYPVVAVRKSSGFVGLDVDEPVDVLAICTLAAAPRQPTANLLAPIAIGRRSRRGAQVLLHRARGDYEVLHPLVLRR